MRLGEQIGSLVSQLQIRISRLSRIHDQTKILQTFDSTFSTARANVACSANCQVHKSTPSVDEESVNADQVSQTHSDSGQFHFNSLQLGASASIGSAYYSLCDAFVRMREMQPPSIRALAANAVFLAVLGARRNCAQSEAEDLVQETWLRLIEHPSNYDRTRPFEPYLFTIAFRLWVDLCRKNGRIPDSHPMPEDEPGQEPLPVDLLSAKEREESVYHCLENLTQMEKAIIVLRFYQGLTYKIIAERLDSTEPRIRNMGFRAIKKLADCMQL